MAGKPKERKDVSETNENQDPDPVAEEMMIPGTSGTSTTEATSKTTKIGKKKVSKPPKKSKKSDEQQGKKQTKITEYLANKTEQSEEIPAAQPESQQDENEDENAEDLIKNSEIFKKSKKVKNTNKTKKKSRRIRASSDHEDEEQEDSSQTTQNKSINEFDRIQQQLTQIEMLRAEFAKGPDISEVIGKRTEAELDPKDPNQSLQAENVPDPDSDSDSEIIDLKQYFFKKSQYKRIRRSLRTIAPKPPPAEDSAKRTKNDFLQLFILDHVPGTGNPNPNPQDPFNIGRMLFDAKIIDNRTMMLLNLWKCCLTFTKLIETFTQNAVEDGVLKIRRSDPKNREPSPEDHHHGRYVNDAQILQQYVNLYARHAKRLMINDDDAAGAVDPEDAVRSNGSRGGSRSAPLFVYCLLAQEICLKTLIAQHRKPNLKYEDDGRGRRRSTFIIDLWTTFPTIPDYASTITKTMMDPNDLDQIKRNKCCCCCWLLKQLSTILIIGLFDCSKSFQLDQLDKFFELLDLIITLQSKMLDCLIGSNILDCLTNQVETGDGVVPKVLSDHVDPDDDHDDHDHDDGQVDDHHDEYDQTLSLYLFLLYICLSLKTFYHAKDKFGLAADAHEDSSFSNLTSGSSTTTINSVQRSFMVYDHLRSMFSKLFETFTGYNRKRVFQKFFGLVFRWHTMDNNPIMVQMDPINISKSTSSRSSSQEDRICIQLIIIIETFSQLMLFLPQWLNETGEHLHLFWMLFTLIKLKCCSGSGTESSSESDGHDAAETPPICRTFEQAIQPMIDIVWRELPFGCQIYLVHFISAYVTRFGTNPFILNLCKTLFNIPGMDFKFRSMISALSMDL